MKKTIAIFLLLILSFTLLCSCSKEQGGEPTSEPVKEIECYSGTDIETFSSRTGKELVKTLDGEGENGGYVYDCGTDYSAAKSLADEYYSYFYSKFGAGSVTELGGDKMVEYDTDYGKIVVMFGQNWNENYAVSVLFGIDL